MSDDEFRELIRRDRREARFRCELLAARYLAAIEGEDFDDQVRLWEVAGREQGIEEIFHQVHRDLIAERDEQGRRAGP